MDSVQLTDLPNLPQLAILPSLTQRLWQQEGVVALWLGGSLAHGRADEYSDIDLRLCISLEAEKRWEQPDLALLLDERIAGSSHTRFGPNHLYQIVLANGSIVDLWVQTTAQKPPQDHVFLIGCRDKEFQQLLVSVEPEPAYAPKPAERVVVCQLVTDFWIDSLKTSKVLYRDLDTIAQIGVGLEHAVIRRLWHIMATGNDTGMQRPTIHGLTAIARHIEALLGPQAQELTGMPLRNRAEICRAVEANRNEVARVGRLLSERLEFAYPALLEDTVQSKWADFLETV